MKVLLLLIGALAAASGLVVSPAAAQVTNARVAASPLMACNGGKGGRGGKSPSKDKNRRGKIRRLVWAVRARLPPLRTQLLPPRTLGRLDALPLAADPLPRRRIAERTFPAHMHVPSRVRHEWQADCAEEVNSILLSSSTESMLLKMNWKFRKSAMHHIKRRAAEFDVEVPTAFAGMDAPKQSTKKHLLTPSVTEKTPSNPKAVAALANLRAS